MNYSRLLQQSHYLEIQARALSESLKSGNFRSLYRGQGIEMSAVRDYIRGDDIRSIDWNVTARMGKPYVKVFEEHKELQVFLIVDQSLSMQVETAGTEEKTKYEAATEAAALLTFAAELNECPVGAVLFDGQINLAILPVWGREQTMNILSNLQKYNLKENHETEIQPGSALDTAINGAGKLLKKRSLVFVFSDFRTTGYEEALGRLSHKNDVIAVRMTNSHDSEIPHKGTVIFEDIETGERKILPSSSAKFNQSWKADNDRRDKNFADFCLKHGILSVNMNTKDEAIRILTEIFNRNHAK